MTIEVNRATEASDELVAAFRRLIPQLSASATIPDRKTLAQVVAAPSNTLLIARDRDQSGAIVGTLTLVVFQTPTTMRARIEDVVVDAGVRGKGVGEALTREALRIATERGARTVDLTSARSREAAHRLYERVGFAIRDTSVYRYVPPLAKN